MTYFDGVPGAVALSSSTQTANAGETNVPNGKIWAWTTPNDARYIKKSDNSDLTGVVSINKNCAITSDKSLYCWDNTFVATQVK